MTKSKKHILILPSWYPNRFAKWNGVFNKAYALGLSKKNSISVLHVDHRDEVKEITINESWDGGFLTVKICIPVKKGFFGKIKNFKTFMEACYLGLDIIEQKVSKINVCHNLVPWKMGLFARELKKKRDIPFVSTIHATAYLPGAGGYSRLQLSSIKKILKEADAITTVSKSLLHSVNEFVPVKSKSKVIPNIVEWVELEHDLPKLENTFIHVSSLNIEQKNPLGIIRAIAAIPDAHLHIYGGYAGDGKEIVLDEIRTLGLENRVAIFKELEKKEMLQSLTQYEAMVHFSNFETFSLVIAEAVSMGLPVIYTASGGPEEYMTEFSGIQVAKNSSEELIHAMNKVLENKSNFDRIKIKEYYRNYFNNEKVSNDFSNLYEEIS